MRQFLVFLFLSIFLCLRVEGKSLKEGGVSIKAGKTVKQGITLDTKSETQILQRMWATARKVGKKVYDAPFTAKQQIWWDSLGVRNPQQEAKQTARVRREVRQLTEGEWAAYSSAVNGIANLYPDPDDPRSQYLLFVVAHETALAPAAHGGSAFLPWHREFLWRYERAIQAVNPDVVLPFWDTTLERDLPDPRDTVAFTDILFGNGDQLVVTGPWAGFEVLDSCLDDQGYPTLYREIYGFTSDVSRLLAFSEEKLDEVFNVTTYQDFSYAGAPFEGHHAGPHFFVGGQLGVVPCSPSDPAFFSHHAFIDLVWQLFRDNYQETDVTLEYPTMNDTNIGGALHEGTANMEPFPGLTNIHGISSHYTDYYYVYADRHYTSCVTSEDCTSQYLWCDVTRGRCLTKVKAGGLCTGIPDEGCYGDDYACVDDFCAQAQSIKQVN